MDYYDELADEVADANSAFHEFALMLSEEESPDYFAFFEGDEDPAFYNNFIRQRIGVKTLSGFVCNGRAQVLKACALVVNDGRAVERSLFFIDKDHSNIMLGARETHPDCVFETDWYSIENYVCTNTVFRRFWQERLHLRQTDDRLPIFENRLNVLREQFYGHMRVLMSMILIGRGIDGREAHKLNLNNVNLEKILRIDFQKNLCEFRAGGSRHFIAAATLPQPSGGEIRDVYAKHLRGRVSAEYVRGKYELWFFWKVVTMSTHELADRASAAKSGKRRATPTAQLPFSACLESFAPLVDCPTSLSNYLAERITH
jgi:hypothetical protein